ncbi:MAG: hypothetical protein JKY48_11735, partial [Flavobacteriales bacterium]|nr:hypothetical protein [Flavobacteriales bacterium]
MKFSFQIVSFLATTFLLLNSLSAQIIGGREPGDPSPRMVEPQNVTADQFGGNVNLFTGVYRGNYTLGAISTPGGLSFSLDLSYASSLTGGGTEPIAKGIPYGEGWNINIPTISISSEVYREHTAAEIATFLSGNSSGNSVNYGINEGLPYAFSIQVNIPGKLNCEAIFKKLDDDGMPVFMPKVFDKYAEIKLLGSTWEVRLEDRTLYRFRNSITSVRAAANKSGILNYPTTEASFQSNFPKILQQTFPKLEVLRWYCTEISNKNLPGQKIFFKYDRFGKFDFYKEFQQAGIKQGYQQYASQKPPTLNVYRDILLTEVVSFDPISNGDRIVLEYKTDDFGTNMLDFRLSNIDRKDSMYNFKTVYAPSNYNHWKRYLHGMHDRLTTIATAQSNTIDGVVGDIGKFDPYLADLTSGGNFKKYHPEEITSTNSSLSFDHGYLESDRISTSEAWIPGELYEIQSTLSNSSNDAFCNFDINLVTGPGSLNISTYANGIDYIHPSNYTGANAPAKESIFSTFNSAVKWNTAGNSTFSSTQTTINTSNYFVMPNLPDSYNGFFLQVGPANSDHTFNMNESAVRNGSAGATAYNAYRRRVFDLNSNNLWSAPDYQAISQNFGIGMPWDMMRKVYQPMSNVDITNASPTYGFWFDRLNTNNNKPTLAGAASLSNVKIVRYSKNPYMLKSVKTYTYSGRVSTRDLTGATLTSQVDLSYDMQNVLGIDNRAYNDVPVSDPYVLGSARQMKTYYLLEEIKNIPVNASGSGTLSNSTVTPSTYFSYSADRKLNYNSSTHSLGWFFLLDETHNALGKKTNISYYPFDNDTNDIAGTFIRPYTLAITKGGQNVTQFTAKVKKLTEEIGNNKERSWIYEYSHHADKFASTPSSQSIILPNADFDKTQLAFGRTGYRYTTVKEPAVNGKRNYTVYEHYTSIAQGAATDLSNINLYAGGKIKRTQQFNADHTLIKESNYEYETVIAYVDGFSRPNRRPFNWKFDYMDFYYEKFATAAHITAFNDQNSTTPIDINIAGNLFFDQEYPASTGKRKSVFVALKRKSEKEFDPDACTASGQGTMNPESNSPPQQGSGYSGYVNPITSEENEELSEIITEAESYESVEELILNNSPLTDQMITSILSNSTFYSEWKKLYFLNLFSKQDTLSDNILYFLATNSVMVQKKALKHYLNSIQLPLTEDILLQIMSTPDIIPVTLLETILTNQSSLSDILLIEVLHKDCEPAVCEVANFDYRESKLYPLVCEECGRV